MPAIKHAKTAIGIDAEDPSRVGSSDWNADHVIEDSSIAPTKLVRPGNTTDFLRGDGTWAAPSLTANYLTLSGVTPGSGASESVELLRAGGLQIIPLENRAYTLKFVVTAVGLISGTLRSRSFEMAVNVRRATGGLPVITAVTASDSYGDLQAISWTFTVAIAASPDRVSLTFGTGSTTSAARVFAQAEVIEVSL